MNHWKLIEGTGSVQGALVTLANCQGDVGATICNGHNANLRTKRERPKKNMSYNAQRE